MRNVQKAPVLVEKRPITVEAWQWDGSDEVADLICEWANKALNSEDMVRKRGHIAPPQKHPHDPIIVIGNNIDVVRPTDWVIRDKFNEFWPLPNDIFHAVYKPLL